MLSPNGDRPGRLLAETRDLGVRRAETAGVDLDRGRHRPELADFRVQFADVGRGLGKASSVDFDVDAETLQRFRGRK